MKKITVSKRSKQINALLKQASKENLILKSPDGSEFILAEVDDFNTEIELARQNEKLMEFLNHRAEQNKTVSLEEVKAKLGLNEKD